MHMNRVDQYLHVFSGCELVDPMAEVEDVRRSLSRARVRRAKTLEYLAGLAVDSASIGEQHSWVEISLQDLGGADKGACSTEIHGPVDAEHLAIELFHLLEPCTSAFREHDPRDRGARVLALELR